MTLLVAANSGQQIWFVADTAITGGVVGLRERQFTKKIETPTAHSIVGFAGDLHIGQRAMRYLAEIQEGEIALNHLKEVTKNYVSVEFAYGFSIGDTVSLYHIAEGHSTECSALHLGNHAAFELFQAARHDQNIDHAPDALHQLMIGAIGDARLPKELISATSAMLRIFAEREEHDVGGWPTPYLLERSGVHPCTYGYSVTDPILNEIRTGQAIPHGTAAAGGFGLSYTNYGSDGMVVYWLQRAGGRVYVPSAEGYDEFIFEGSPITFADGVEAKLGERPNIWFGENTLDQPDEVRILYDEQKNERMALARNGKTLSFSWIQGPSESFHTSSSIDFQEMPLSADKEFSPIRVEPLPDETGAVISQISSGSALTLSSQEIDSLILMLSKVRAELMPPVKFEFENLTLVSTIDPAWRTQPSPHPSVPGAILALRHHGLGWLGFVIPPHEQAALGKWLLESSSRS